jgi:methyl-accepting chemotaxis protein
VTNNVENISVVVEQSTAGSEEISASTSEQFRSFEKMLKKVMILRELTEDLNQEVGKFNVKTEQP